MADAVGDQTCGGVAIAGTSRRKSALERSARGGVARRGYRWSPSLLACTESWAVAAGGNATAAAVDTADTAAAAEAAAAGPLFLAQAANSSL